MRIITLENKAPTLAPSVATIGFFDGVHRGHQYLISQVKEVAARAGLASMVITFDQHPRQALHSDYVPQMLSTLKEKLALIEKTGVDYAVVLHFDTAMAQMTAHDFMLQVLKEQLQVGKLVIGYDNRFGCGRTDGFEQYVEYGREMNLEVLRAEALMVDGQGVSSSLIRRLLQQGDVAKAASLLGYHYTIDGTVVDGYHEGRKMGFPTANIDVQTVSQLVPTDGVYAVRVGIEGSSEQHIGMTNIGRRPTFDGTDTTIETNIFDFVGNLYGRRISLALSQRLRSEHAFDTPEQLAEQLAADRKEVERILKQS